MFGIYMAKYSELKLVQHCTVYMYLCMVLSDIYLYLVLGKN